MKKTLLRMAMFQQNCSKPHFIIMFGEKKGENHYLAYEGQYKRNILAFWADELTEKEQDIIEDYVEKMPLKDIMKKRPR
jgi:hypothetical protein